MKLDNQIAFVSGANRGVGAAIVSSLLASNIGKVYAAARDPQTISVTDPRVIPVALDLSQPNSISDACGPIDHINILFNNAGVLEVGGPLDATEQQLSHCLEVNLYGLLRLTRALESKFKAQSPAAIVNILSLLSLASMPGFSAYNASKAAAWSVHLSLRANLSPRGITVHGVYPGAIDTDMLAAIDTPKANPMDVAQAIIAGISHDQEDIFPDPVSQQVYAQWRQDHRIVEQQFATMS